MQARTIQKSDYEGAYRPWYDIRGFGIQSIDDSEKNIEKFLDRNPDPSTVAVIGQEIVGSILCGHDGRTGGFYHVYMHRNHKEKDIAHEMTKFCPEALKSEKINKIALIAFKSNDLGNESWRHYSFTLREDANYYDLLLDSHGQASFNV